MPFGGAPFRRAISFRETFFRKTCFRETCLDSLTLITGGVSSGKTAHACRSAAEHGKRVLYVATCEPFDAEMHAKIARHRAERPREWTTVERSQDVARALVPGYDAAVVDCLTLLLAQLLQQSADELAIAREVRGLAAVRPGYPIYVVSNEVGLGGVSPNAEARRFAELQGRANQQLARYADAVVCVISGLPMQLKGSSC